MQVTDSHPVVFGALDLYEENIQPPAIRRKIHKERVYFADHIVLDKQLSLLVLPASCAIKG